MRGARLTARVGVALGICFGICFVTGLLSHWIQHPPGWFWWPTQPSWLYRFTQGLHVTTGVAAIPLLLVKLGTVYPKLFARPRIGSPVRLLERASITVLVVAAIFQLFTGLLNIAQWYPWKFFFTTTHYATAWIAIGAVLVHIAVKLPVIRTALGEPLDAPEVLPDGSSAPPARRTTPVPSPAAPCCAAPGRSPASPQSRWSASRCPSPGGSRSWPRDPGKVRRASGQPHRTAGEHHRQRAERRLPADPRRRGA